MPPRTATRSKADIRHKDGCPADRIESYPTTRPNGDVVTVTRCQDCAEQVVTSGAPSSGRSSDGDDEE
jgi:hypothetical protein